MGGWASLWDLSEVGRAMEDDTGLAGEGGAGDV